MVSGSHCVSSGCDVDGASNRRRDGGVIKLVGLTGIDISSGSSSQTGSALSRSLCLRGGGDRCFTF